MDLACEQNIMLVDSGSVMIYNDLVSSDLHPFMLTIFPGYEELLSKIIHPLHHVWVIQNLFQEHLTEFHIFYWIPHSPDFKPHFNIYGTFCSHTQ